MTPVQELQDRNSALLLGSGLVVGQNATPITLTTLVTRPFFLEEVERMARRRAVQSHPRLISGNLLVYGDNLRVMRESPFFRDESVDLIYLDPPFKHDEKYNVLFRAKSGTPSQAQVRAFDDAWNWEEAAKVAYHDVMENSPLEVRRTIDALDTILERSDMFAYLCMMAPRLVELHRVLRETGSIYLHCDPAASHYLKLLMDAVFGPTNFRNEIIWKRTSAHSNPRRWGPVHDVILFYSKSDAFTWNPQTQSYGQAYLDSKYRHKDERGTYRLSDLTGSGLRTGDSGKPWRGFDPTSKGRHWGVPVRVVTSLLGARAPKQMTTQEKLDLLDEHGYIYWTPKGRKGGVGFPQMKRHQSSGMPIQDVISDIAPINSMAAERLRYPTQKPETLLERLIAASSNRNDTVLDPFCGCGTTVAAAQFLKRKWIGVDVAYDAIKIIRDRMQRIGLKDGRDYEVWGDPESLEDAMSLADEHKYQFQWWAVRRLGAREIDYKRGADQGVDGRLVLRAERLGRRLPEAIIQVKAGKATRAHVAQLTGDVEGENVELGVLVTRTKATKAMREAASRVGDYTDGKKWYPRIQLLTAADIIAGKGVEYPERMLTAKKAVPKKPTASKAREKPTSRKAT